ncbi:hypothetical protein L1987_12773 [Smallanthus sonchifolius]|uniref:Uncharacterized protein n=1 Tax=Smallanthus sonchifolius TaxID=185202 RepID=A0ACB9JGW3_9ASTR|nr:hypothetical protein L1987_12773 [Smallanthus sonchifolius]
MGVLGCVSCIVGSVITVIHAPEESTPTSVQEIWNLATEPAFLIYIAATLSLVAALGISQIAYPQTWVFVTVAVLCVITQLNYLNKETSAAPGAATWYNQDPIKAIEEDAHLITVHNSDYFD